jgi:endonuclease/exonuclease/phosphatase family metal-dependent hydrolase
MAFALLAVAVASWTLTAACTPKPSGAAHAAVHDQPAAHKAAARQPLRSSSGQDAGVRASTQPTPFRVMTYNVRHDDSKDDALGRGWMTRRSQVLQLVLDTAPDIVGFQEISRIRGLPAPEQPEAYVRAHLEPAGYRMVPGKGGSPKSIFYKASRFSVEPMSTPHAAFLWPDPHATMCPDEGPPMFVKEASHRSATWCVLRDQQTGRRLFVVNAHLASGKALSAARVHQAHCVRQIVARLAGDLPVVLLGDLNATVDTPELRELVGPSVAGAITLDDTGSPAGEGSFNGFCERHCKPRGKIDFVLQRGLRIVEPARVIKLKPGGTWPSDHMPVLATLEFPGIDGADAGSAEDSGTLDGGG